ncbi:MAG: OstA-like protein, partial [Lutimonas sp.]
MKSVLFVFMLVFTCFILQGQGKRIQILHSDNSTIDEVAYPGATVLIGNVYIRHEGITLKCKKAIHYKNENYIKAYGNVILNQGDSIRQTSQYTEYNGDTKKALSWGRVMLKDPQMT